MLIRKEQMPVKELQNCHEGSGVVRMLEALAQYDRAVGIRFVHDDTLPPGTTIGVHEHQHDEEIYLVLEGEGEIQLDGKTLAVKSGDIGFTTAGHSHGIANTGKAPLRLLVVGVALPRS